jgi:plastocyanin
MALKQLRVLALLVVIGTLGTLFLVACARPGTVASSGGSTSNANSCPTGTEVTTSSQTFNQTCITLAKGGTLKITPGSGSTVHILDWGQWSSGTAAPATYTNVPALSNVQLTSSSISVGPLTTAGTYHIYCTIHSGMDLTVIVK